ncbi:MAG: heavy-metal-associated domain-containing protein [Thermoanaerobaculia bacterium]
MIATISSALVLATILQPGLGYLSPETPMSTSFVPTAQAENLETVVLDVSGMWATFFESYLEQSLVEPLQGVDRVEADHYADTVTVSFDPEKLNPEEIAAAIERCPFFDVTGSPTHALNREVIKRHRRCWCCLANRDDRSAGTKGLTS